MREKLKTLPLAELREIAKSVGIKSCYAFNKTALIEKILEVTANQEVKPAAGSSAPAVPETPAEKSPDPSSPAAPAPKKRGRKPGKKNESAAEPAPAPDEESGENFVSEKAEYQSAPRDNANSAPESVLKLDTGKKGAGLIEIMPEGYGFIRSRGYYPGDDDIYVAQSQIKRFNIKTGDYISGSVRTKEGEKDKYGALLYIDSINNMPVSQHEKLTPFEDLTPTFPKERLRLEMPGGEISMRIVDLLCPIGKGQRGMIVAQPKVGKTTLLKQIAKSLLHNHPELHIMILLIDERPEEVTDIQDSFDSERLEIIYSTFDELPEHHKRVSEITIERAKRLVENKKDVVVLLDSITRLTRAYNLTCVSSGRTLSGGLDPAALYMPKRFFGAARCMKEGGSLTILATALQDTGSRLDDVVYEEFKGTGNMELVLNRKLSERRIFPAIDILKSSTRRDDLLLTPPEQDAAAFVHRITTQGPRAEALTEQVLDLFQMTRSNAEFIAKVKSLQYSI